MKGITILLMIVTANVVAQKIDIPADLDKQNILVELNSFEETVELINKEFERSNSEDKRDERKKAVEEAKTPNNRIEIGVYGVAIPDNIVDWINETIVKSLGKNKERQYTVVDEKNMDKFPADKWRYVLRYKYLLTGGDPLETKMIFYFFDRKENKDLINYDKVDSSATF